MELLNPSLGVLLFSAFFSIVFTAFVFKAVCFDPLLKEVKALRNQLAVTQADSATITR